MFTCQRAASAWCTTVAIPVSVRDLLPRDLLACATFGHESAPEPSVHVPSAFMNVRSAPRRCPLSTAGCKCSPFS